MKKLAFAALIALVSASGAHAQAPSCTAQAIRTATQASQIPCTMAQAYDVLMQGHLFDNLTQDQAFQTAQVINAFFALNAPKGPASNPFLR